MLILSNPDIVYNIRPNPNYGSESVQTGNGTREFEYVANSNIFGQVYFDPGNQPNILPYAWLCRNFRVEEYRPDPFEPTEYISVFFPSMNKTKFFHIQKNGTYMSDFSDWFKIGFFNPPNKRNRLFSAIKEEPIYSRRQQERIEEIVNKSPDLGFMSLEDILSNVKHGHIANCPYSEEEIARAVREKVRDVNTIRGKSKLRSQPAVDYSQNLKPKELVLHGDLLTLWKMFFLILVTQPGSYAIVSHLAGGKNKASLLLELRNAVGHLKAFGWTPKILVFDGERAITWLDTEIGELGMESIALPPEIFAHYVEVRIKHIKERVRCIYSRVKNDLKLAVSEKLGKWMVIAGGAYTNWVASSTNPDHMPPYRFITGLKLDLETHAKLTCGDYCEIFEPGVTRNSPDERTSPAIALAPTIRGHWWFMKISDNMSHWPIVKRSQYIRLPVNANVRHLCSLYAALHPLEATANAFDDITDLMPSTIVPKLS